MSYNTALVLSLSLRLVDATEELVIVRVHIKQVLNLHCSHVTNLIYLFL